MISHVTFRGKKPLCDELVAAFSNINQQKSVLDTVNCFHPLTFGMTVPLFTEKFYRVKVVFFQQSSIFDHLYLLKTKSRKISPNVARQIINLQRKRSSIDQEYGNPLPIRQFTKFDQNDHVTVTWSN